MKKMTKEALNEIFPNFEIIGDIINKLRLRMKALPDQDEVLMSCVGSTLASEFQIAKDLEDWMRLCQICELGKELYNHQHDDEPDLQCDPDCLITKKRM
jgi:hypothetical protein